MKKTLISILVLTFGCNSDNRHQRNLSKFQNKLEPCAPEWNATGKELKQVDINDTMEQIFLNDTLGVEVIGESLVSGDSDGTGCVLLSLVNINTAL